MPFRDSRWMPLTECHPKAPPNGASKRETSVSRDRSAHLVFDESQAPCVTDFHASELLLPLVAGVLADAVAPAKLINGSAGLGLIEDLDHLLFGVSLSFHGIEDVMPLSRQILNPAAA